MPARDDRFPPRPGGPPPRGGTSPGGLVSLDPRSGFWQRVHTVAPLVVVGTREEDGSHDLAPKHLVLALGEGGRFAFVCTPRHRTYRNARREGAFTVSYPAPDQVVLASLAASPRCDDGVKHALGALPTTPAVAVDGVFLAEAQLCLECRLERVVEITGELALLVGEVVAAHARPECLRGPDLDDQEIVAACPLLAFLPPGRFARVTRSLSFPFVEDMRR